MADNVKARIMLSDGTYVQTERRPDEEKINSQEYFYEEAYRRLEEKTARQERMKAVREKKAEKNKSTTKKKAK